MTEELQESRESESTMAVETSQPTPTPAPTSTPAPTPTASSSTMSAAELVATFQKAKREEQELAKRRQSLQMAERSLRNRIVDEIDKTNSEIEALKSEVVNLQDRCNELSKALGFPASKVI